MSLAQGPTLGRYLVVIDGTEQGTGWVRAGDSADRIYLDGAIARPLGLNCERTLELSSRSKDSVELCRIRLVEYRITETSPEAQRIEIKTGADSYQNIQVLTEKAPVEKIPEYKPGNLGFASYNVYAAKSGGKNSPQVQLNSRAGVRFLEHALDVDFTAANSEAKKLSGENTFRVTGLAYRREWFDNKVRLAAGRVQGSTHSLGIVNTVDGLSISKPNIDQQGNSRVVGGRPISGVAPSAGLLIYRIGSVVYREIPIQAGPFEIDGSVLSGLPVGGVVELQPAVGQAIPLDLPFVSGRPDVLYMPGTYSWDLSVGVLPSGLSGAVIEAGGRYGISKELSVGSSTSFHNKANTATLDFAYRLPASAGEVSLGYGRQEQRTENSPKIGSSLVGGYKVGGRHWSLSTDYQRSSGGGIVPLSQLAAKQRELASRDDGESVAVSHGIYIDAPVLNRGVTTSFKKYLSKDSADINWSASLSVGGSLMGSTSWNATVRRIEYSSKKAENQVYAGISFPLDARHTINFSGFSGGSGLSDFRASVNGSHPTDWEADATYSMSATNRGTASASYARQSNLVNTFGSLYLDEKGDASGYGYASGAVVFANDQYLPTKDLDTTIMVINGDKELAGGLLYSQGSSKPVAQFNENGYVVVPGFLKKYQLNKFKAVDDGSNLGVVVPDEVITAAVHPYRGYVVPLDVEIRKPVRIKISFPDGRVIPNATPLTVGEREYLIEFDGSVYIESISALTSRHGVFRLSNKTCTVDLADLAKFISESYTGFTPTVSVKPICE